MDLFGLNKTILFHEKMVWGAPGTRRYKKILTQTSDILRLVALIWTCRILFINMIQHIRYPIIIYVSYYQREKLIETYHASCSGKHHSRLSLKFPSGSAGNLSLKYPSGSIGSLSLQLSILIGLASPFGKKLAVFVFFK